MCCGSTLACFTFYFCCFDSFAHAVLSVAMVTACHYYMDSDTEGPGEKSCQISLHDIGEY